MLPVCVEGVGKAAFYETLTLGLALMSLHSPQGALTEFQYCKLIHHLVTKIFHIEIIQTCKQFSLHDYQN